MNFPEFEKIANNFIQASMEFRRLSDLRSKSKQPNRYTKQIVASRKKATTAFGKISHLVSRYSDRRLDLGDGDIIDPFVYFLTYQGQKGGASSARIVAMLMSSILDTVQQLAETRPNIPIEELPKRKAPIPFKFSDTDETLPKANTANSLRVFLVHGHAERAVHETARFLEKLGLEVIILREQPSSGRTIIEKIIDYSDVKFAIILLTGDDRGGTKNTSFKNLSPRARQNVILELGFFIGKLGRERVCALYEDGVEIPSDYRGVLFVALDSLGAWRLELSREIKAAGIPINLSDVL